MKRSPRTTDRHPSACSAIRRIAEYARLPGSCAFAGGNTQIIRFCVRCTPPHGRSACFWRRTQTAEKLTSAVGATLPWRPGAAAQLQYALV